MSIAVEGAPDSEKPMDVLPSGADEPVWSPDGTLVAFGVVTKDGSSHDLWFARSGGGGASGLTTKFWCREWTWSPDGSKIAFVVGKATGSSLWTANLADKDVKLIYKGFCSAPSYSPDGKRLAIAIPDVRSGWKIRLIDIGKQTDKLIGVRSFGGKKITWSPDGKRLFFESSRKGEPAVWSIGVDGKNLQRVTPEGTRVQGASFSPDCSRLAAQVMGSDSYSPELCVCSVSGGKPAKLTKSSESYWSPVWSRDGKRLAFQSDRNHANELYVGPSNGRSGKAVYALLNPDPSEVS